VYQCWWPPPSVFTFSLTTDDLLSLYPRMNLANDDLLSLYLHLHLTINDQLSLYFYFLSHYWQSAILIFSLVPRYWRSAVSFSSLSPSLLTIRYPYIFTCGSILIFSCLFTFTFSLTTDNHLSLYLHFLPHYWQSSVSLPSLSPSLLTIICLFIYTWTSLLAIFYPYIFNVSRYWPSTLSLTSLYLNIDDPLSLYLHL